MTLTQQAEALLDDFAKRAEGEERKWYNIAQAFRSAEEKIADARMDAEDAAWVTNGLPTIPAPLGSTLADELLLRSILGEVDA